jgi:hypothetical protein
MKKLALFVVIVSLCLIGTIVYAAPYAAHLGTSAPTLVQGGSVDLDFVLNEEATTVTLEVIGPLPATTVQRTFNLGPLSHGDQSVAWDGKDDLSANVPLGNYKFKVKAESDGYGSSWKNVTPLGAYDSWTTPTAELGIANTPNLRGIGFNGTNLVIACTAPISLMVMNSSGEYQHNLGLTVVDTYDADNDANYAETWDLNAWLGPYDIATATDGSLYLSAYRGAGFPIARIESDAAAANPVAVGFLNANCRAMDVVNAGANTIIYEGGNTGSTATRVHTSTDGTTFTLLESTAAMPNSHMIIGRDGNTGGDGDVLWCSTNSGYVQRWVRSSGVWAQDTAFSGPENTCGGDYVQIGGQDVIAVILNSNNDIVLANGDTGAELGRWVPPGSRASWGGNGDLVVRGGAIYFVLPDYNLIGKLAYGEISSAQYYSPQGVTVVYDQTNPDFGRVYISEGYPATSSNPGAETDEQGVYSLRNDLSYYGGSVANSWALSGNDPNNHWDPTDSWSPRKIHIGDDNLVCLGDSGTNNVTDDFYLYYPGTDPVTTATAVLVAAGANHGRVCAGQTVTSGTTRVLYGVDRDQGGDAYPDFYVWQIGNTLDNYTGMPTQIWASAGASNPTGSTLYTTRDMVIGRTTGHAYFVNARYATTQPNVYCFDRDDGTGTGLIWSKTAAQIYADSGNSISDFTVCDYAFGIAEDEARGRIATCQNSSTCGGADIIIYDYTNGVYITHFAHGGTSCNAVAFDPAGNLLTASANNEHVRMWAPPGASNYTTTYFGSLAVATPSPTPTPTPTPTSTPTPTPSPTPTGLQDWGEY